MVHKPKHRVHSFRGLLIDAGQDEIHLERQNLNIAYRIVKFQLIGYNPGATSNESVVKVWRERQGLDDGSGDPYGLIDFSFPDLLAAGYYSGGSTQSNPQDVVIIVDNILFSRNIFITHFDSGSDVSINYYLEIEEVPVGAATLMQIKLGSARKLISDSMGD